MIRPASFAHNEQTAGTNAFQRNSPAEHRLDIAHRAVAEFDAAVETLRGAGLNILVFSDAAPPHKPDAVFPNNWFSTHAGGELVLYPMFAPNRRLERRLDIRAELELNGYHTRRVANLIHWEERLAYLEGTGSLVLDRVNNVAFACRSPRTCEDVFRDWAAQLGFRTVMFDAYDQRGQSIYHTNVMMCVGTNFVAIAADCIAIESREKVLAHLIASGRQIIELTWHQISRFAGNMLEVETQSGRRVALSTTALDALTVQQRARLESLAGPLLPLSISTIEHHGGGSVRCMLAEIFLPRS